MMPGLCASKAILPANGILWQTAPSIPFRRVMESLDESQMPKLPSNRAAGALDREDLSMPALRLVSAGLSKRAKEKSERAEKSRGRNQTC
jgi:hypothetical protein